jgi:thiamine biosynthesis lipoprotein
MACRFEITLSAEDSSDVRAASEALDMAEALEETLSHFRATSDLTRLNRAAAEGPVPVAPDVMRLLLLCRRLYESTGGAFDVTSTPLSRVWGFLERQGRVPDAEVLLGAMRSVGMGKVQLDEASRCVWYTEPGVEVSFGAVGKGWALDRMASTLRERGVGRALLSAGGSSFRALGGEAGEFLVDVAREAGGPLARVRLVDAALGVTTAAEQFFEAEGRSYGHVLDPRTGRPAEAARAAAVVAREAADADALATAFFVGGADLAESYCATHPDVAVLVAPPGEGPACAFGRDAAEIFEA